MNNTIISILAGLGGMFGWGTSDFFANNASEKVGHTKTFFWSQLAGMLAMGIIFVIFKPVMTGMKKREIVLLLIASVLYTAGYLFFYKAFEIGNVSVVSATINLNTVIAIMLAYVFLGQRLTGLQIPAIILVLLGITFVSINFNDLHKNGFSLLVGVKEVIIASFAFGIFWTLSDVLSENVGWIPLTLFIKIISIGLMVGLSFIGNKEKLFESNVKKFWLVISLVGILEALAMASVNFGLSVGDLVIVNPIASALSIVTISMAVIFLKEKISKTQAIGIFMTIGGIILSAF